MITFIVWSAFIAIGSSRIEAADLPCAARDGAPGQGQICVCNSTYCDTIAQPSKLDNTQFHYYKTSGTSPGFTQSILAFSKELPKESNDKEVVFTIDASQELQEHLGMGGSFTDSMGLLYFGLSNDTQEKLMESYFGITGIEYSLARFPVGNTDFSFRTYTLDDVPFDNDLKSFSLAEEDYKYKIPMMKEALSLSQRGIKMSACSWGAPYWMKAGQSIYAGYIAQNYSGLWADYQIKVLQGYKDAGIDIWSLSGGNEPLLLYVLPLTLGMLNSTLYTADIQVDWLKNHLKPKLQASNFSHVKFLGLDDQSIFLPYWIERFNLDPAALAAMDGVGLHWYFDWFMNEQVLEGIYNNFHKTNPDKLMLYTEGSINAGFGDDPVLLGSWYRAEGYIYRIFQMLNNWNAGYIDWNLFLNPEGGPNTSFGIECPVIVNTTSDEFYKQPIFYGIGHFSKFIQPGAKQAQVTESKPAAPAYSSQDLEEVLASMAARRLGTPPVPEPPVHIPERVKSLAYANPDSSFTVIVINTKNATVPVRIEDSRVGSIVMKIEEHSINSFVYWP